MRVFDNMVLRRIFGPKTDDVTVDWRKVHNEELNDLYTSPNTILVIKPRTKRRAWQLTLCWGGGGSGGGFQTGFWWGTRSERVPVEPPDVDGAIL
jgi:hypothetical protein